MSPPVSPIRTIIALIVPIVVLAVAHEVAGQTPFFELHRLIEGGPPIDPDVPFRFEDFGAPSIDGLDVAFAATTSQPSNRGVFKGTIGSAFQIRVVADNADGSFGATQAGLEPSIDGGRVLANGTHDSRIGIWPSEFFLTTGPAIVDSVVDRSDLLPTTLGGTVMLTSFDRPSISHGRAVFSGTNSPQVPHDAGVWRSQGGAPSQHRVIVDNAFDPMLGQEYFNVGLAAVGGLGLAFNSNDSPGGTNRIHHMHLVGAFFSDPVELAHSGMPIPGGGTLNAPLFPAVDNDTVVFVSGDNLGRPGLYKATRGVEGISIVANSNTPIPEGDGNFTGFHIYASIDDGNIVFQGSGANGQQGIYLAHRDGTLRKVIAGGDLFNGEPVAVPRVGPEAISDDRIAFSAFVGTGIGPPQGLYLATFGSGHLSLPGNSPTNPLLPAVISPGNFMFSNARTGHWFDPPLVPGYEYVMESDALFTAILEFPDGFDQPFQVIAEGIALGEFEPGESVNFVQMLGHGVDRFTVAGISPAVDAEDPAGFPLRIAFDMDVASFRMQAIPEPGSSALLALGTLLLAGGTYFYPNRARGSCATKLQARAAYWPSASS